MTIEGGCLCGAVRYSVRGSLRNPCNCHCESCRRASGGAFVPWATCDDTAFRVTAGEIVERGTSLRVSRGFCGGCGTSLTYRHEERADEVDVALVSLDEPSMVAPTCHIWTRDRLPWISIDDGLPAYDTVPLVD